MRRAVSAALAAVLAACGTVSPSPSPSPTLAPLPPLDLGAGFRYSTYGIGPNDPGPEYWLDVGQGMAGRFEGATPQAIWIVAEIGGTGAVLTFPGSSDDTQIHFSMEDNNEAALDLFDEAGFGVWLQVEPGDAPVLDLIDIILERYKHHSSVLGIGVDVEWLNSYDEPEGRPVTDEEARTWLAAVRAHDPDYRIFLKHWEIDVMPPTERDGIVFISDEQGFADFDAMVDSFTAWGEHFALAQVGFQYGYAGDQGWWDQLADPPRDIGQRLLDTTPNAIGVYWVDFTVREIFEPPE